MTPAPITTPAEALEAAARECDMCPDSHWGPWLGLRVRALSARIAPPVMSVETVAADIWRAGLGNFRPDDKWPDDVRGNSQDVFRRYARAAIIAMGGTPDE